MKHRRRDRHLDPIAAGGTRQRHVIQRADRSLRWVVAGATFVAIAATGCSGATSEVVFGDCFDYTAEQVAVSVSPPSGPVPCDDEHTAEVYRIAPWPAAESPSQLSAGERLEYAQQVCLPMDAGGAAFNYWAFYVPTEEQWQSGDRWVRCDAMEAVAPDGALFARWTGSRLEPSGSDGVAASSAESGFSEEDFREAIDTLFPGWTVQSVDVPAESSAFSSLFSSDPMSEGAGFFTMAFLYGSAADAQSPSEVAYLGDASDRAHEQSPLYWFEPVQCRNIVFVVREDVAQFTKDALTKEYGC